MKKRILLLPLAAILLTGCSNLGSLIGKGISIAERILGTSLTSNTASSSNSSSTSQSSSSSISATTQQLPSGGLLIAADDLFDSSKSGYAGYAGDYTLSGISFTLDYVFVNKYGTNPNETIDVEVNILQFKAATGNITVGNVKATKVTVVELSTYGWSNPLTLTTGTTAVAKPTAAQNSETTAYVYSKSGTTKTVYRHTTVYNVNASQAEDLVIATKNTYASYYESIKIE